MSSQARPSNPSDTSAAGSRARLLRYAIMFAVPALVLYFAIFVVMRTSLYMRVRSAPMILAMTYSFEPHLDADVVLFGDSSALLGIDTVTLSHDLHRKVINLPNTLSTVAVAKDLSLERYLEHNKRPSLLVFYFTPWDLDFEHQATAAALLEGQEMVLRYGDARQVFQLFRQYPANVLQFPFRFYASNNTMRDARAIARGNPPPPIIENQGHYPQDAPTLQAPCVIPESLVKRTLQNGSVAHLVEHYRSLGYRVLVIVAPIPECVNAAEVTGQSYAAIDARPPQTLPVVSFAADNYFAHLDRPKVAQATALLERTLSQTLTDHSAAP